MVYVVVCVEYIEALIVDTLNDESSFLVALSMDFVVFLLKGMSLVYCNFIEDVWNKLVNVFK